MFGIYDICDTKFIQSRHKIAILVISRLKVGKIYQNRPKCYGWSKKCSKVILHFWNLHNSIREKKNAKNSIKFLSLGPMPEVIISKVKFEDRWKIFRCFFQPRFRQKWSNSSLYISNSYESECAISAKFWVKVKILAKNRILGENLTENGSNLGP